MMINKRLLILGAILFGIALGCIWAWMSFNPTPKSLLPLHSSTNFFSTSAEAQVITNPSPSAMACAYNSSPPTVTSGKFVFVQCNSSGALVLAP